MQIKIFMRMKINLLFNEYNNFFYNKYNKLLNI